MNQHPTPTAAISLGRALRARRKALGISMTAAAEAAGMSRYTWHKLEHGETQVQLGFMLEAARVLNLECHLQDRSAAQALDREASPEGWLPLDIHLDRYTGLKRLAWQLRQGVETLSPREAWELYERNGRHLDPERLEPEERALMRALRHVYGGMHDLPA